MRTPILVLASALVLAALTPLHNAAANPVVYAQLQQQSPQAPCAAGDDRSFVIVAGPDSGPALIRQLDFVPAGIVGPSLTDYVTISIYETDGLGGASSALVTYDTSIVPWHTGKIAMTWAPTGGYALPAGHSLMAQVTTESGTGTALPAGMWRIQ